MLRALGLAVLIGVGGGVAGADLSEQDQAALAEALVKAQHEMDALTAAMGQPQLDAALHPELPTTTADAVALASDQAHQLVAGDTPRTVDLEGLRAQIEALTLDQLGKDAVQEALASRLGRHGAGDPNGAMSFQSGPQGLLWIFWATDAPGAEILPGQIAAAERQYPELIVRDLHVARLSDWHAMLAELSRVKDYLEKRDPTIPVAEEARRKRDFIDQNLKKYRALTTMATTRRNGGYLVCEDMAPGIAWNVTDLPTLVFVSPRGLVHRVKGLSPERDIPTWIASDLAWEEQNRSTLEARGVRW